MELSKNLTDLFDNSPEVDKQVSTDYATGSLSVGEGLKALFTTKEGEPQAPLMGTPPETLMGKADFIFKNLIATESSGVHYETDGTLRVSEKGAQGITQLMPKTAKNPGYGVAPVKNNSPEEYLRFGKDYLTKMISMFNNVEQGVAAYNAGPGTVHRALSKADRTGRDWKEFLPQETKDYIKKVAK